MALALILLSQGTGSCNASEAQPGPTQAERRDAALSVPADIAALQGSLDRIYLYSVKDGQLQTTLLRAQDLVPNSRLPVAGYVTGLVIRGSAQLEPRIDRMQMDAVRQSGDSTVHIRNFGYWTPDPRPQGTDASKDWAGDAGERRSGRTGDDWIFSLFPVVFGAPLCSAEESDLLLHAGGATLRLPLYNPGYREIALDPAPVPIRYLGTRLEGMRGRSADFQERIDAILAGIADVEAALDMALVVRVNIVDYKTIRNAVTVKGHNDIWIYLSSFSGEPVQELRTMAAHETIHLYVDHMRLTRSSRLRELFADLKGYGRWSPERFELVTGGRIENLADADPGQAHPFFAFIDERNFQEGKSGGHSQADLDEFCTSFIHSLMFADRIGANLRRPLKLPGGPSSGVSLTATDRDAILATYTLLLEIIRDSVEDRNFPKAAAQPGQALFRKAHRQLDKVG